LINGTNKNAVTKRAMVIDMLDAASAVEEILSNANLLRQYPVGVYLNDKAEPTLVPSEQYFFEKIVPKIPEVTDVACRQFPGMVAFDYLYEPVIELSQVLLQPWDVVRQVAEVETKIFYDQPTNPVGMAREITAYEVVATHHELKGATLQPRLPMYGLQLVFDIIEDDVLKDLSYDTGHAKVDLEDIVIKYVADQFKQITQADRDAARKTGEMVYAHRKPEFIALTKQVYEVCASLLDAIRSFVKNNDGPFVGSEGYAMYNFDKLTSITLVLEYKGDYRIMDWQRKMDEGTWA
jgi:hypothetical protein